MDNLAEMDRFLEKFNLPRLNQEEIETMKNSIANTEMKPVIKKISQKTKAQKPKVEKAWEKIAKDNL